MLAAEVPVNKYALEDPDRVPVSQIFTSGSLFGTTNSVPCVYPKVAKELSPKVELKNVVQAAVLQLRFILSSL